MLLVLVVLSLTVRAHASLCGIADEVHEVQGDFDVRRVAEEHDLAAVLGPDLAAGGLADLYRGEALGAARALADAPDVLFHALGADVQLGQVDVVLAQELVGHGGGLGGLVLGRGGVGGASAQSLDLADDVGEVGHG